MNIEQKNTLFVISLVIAVLSSVAALAFVLVAQHVHAEIDDGMKRGHMVLVEAQKQSFLNLLAGARRLADESSLIAATLTGDLPTIQGTLAELGNHSDLDLLAVYPGGAQGQVGHARRPQLASPQVLSSRAARTLVASVAEEGKSAFGHTLELDSLIRLVAVPIQNPLGGQMGTLLVGKEIDAAEIALLRDLVGAEVVVHRGNLIFGSTFGPGVSPPEQILNGESSQARRFSLGGEEYHGQAFPVLEASRGSAVASVLLALPTDKQWEPYRELTRTAFYFSTLILLFAALLGIWISRSTLTKPLQALATLTTAIGKGDLDVKVSDTRKDELGDLARSFNQMLERLKASQVEELHSRQRFHDFAESTSDWLWETNAQGQFTYVSQYVLGTLAVPPEDLLGLSFAEAFPQDNLRELMTRLRGVGDKYPLKDNEIWITSREGYRLCLRLNGMPYYDGETFKGFRGTARDITKVKNDEERLIHLANRDHLTGLSNRRRFVEDLVREIDAADRQKQSGALLLIDLDHFKLVNDTAGHAAGDEVIIQVSGMLRRLARKTDLVARLSGDEFVIAFVNTNPEEASRRGTELLTQLSQLKPTYGGKILSTSASIGIVVFPEHGRNPAELMAKADTAMYAAKKAGRNRFHLYSEQDGAQQRLGSQLTWKERIHEALEHDRFELAFQPIASTTGEPVGRYEVLVRMKASDGSLYMPGSFIPTAEQFGLIHQLDTLILRKAIHRLAALPRSNPLVSFSVNLSGLSVGDAHTMQVIEEALQTTHLDRTRLIFEITESAACEDVNRAMEFIARIQRMGCRIALDDFGVGFSSFSYLKHLKPDIIKIDGSFIRNISTSKEDQLFVKALVDVSKGMGMLTVAEFVENAECLRTVRTLGVDYAQGYHIGRPSRRLFEEGRVSGEDHSGEITQVVQLSE